MKLMIGVSTEQNTVNLIPLIQLKADKLLLIETSLAAKKNWSKGLLEVLNIRGIKVEILKLENTQDNRIDFIYNILYEKFSDSQDQIIWNLGGGQKPQQMGIWQTFNKLNRPNHSVCYSNPATKKIEKWTLHEEQLIYQEEDIKVAISAEEIFKVYGQHVKSVGEKFYQKNEKIKIKETIDLFNYPEFRKYFFSLSGVNIASKNSQTYTFEELRNTLEQLKKNSQLKSGIIEKIDKNIPAACNNLENFQNYSFLLKNYTLDFVKMSLNKNTDSTKSIQLKDNSFKKLLINLKYPESSLLIDYQLIKLLVNKDPKKPSNYFEEVLVKRTKELLEVSDNTNFIFEAYANFESTSGEYDILLVTTWGTLIALDAKTFDVDKKDSDARLYNLTLSGGKYVDWIPVLPYDPECIVYMSDKLKNLPKTLADMKKKFFVISDNYSQDYQHTINTLEIPMLLFDNFLKHLNLINLEEKIVNTV